MAETKTVRGTVAGVTVSVSEETADLLGSSFEPEKTTAKKTASSKSSSN